MEALEAIFAPGDVERTGDGRVRVRVAPEPDGEGHVYGTATLEFAFPPEYPASKPPRISASGGEGLSEEAATEIQAVAERAAEEGLGSVVVFSVADAVREWLQEHARQAAPEPPEPDAGGGPEEEAEGEEDDLDVDSEDLDGEMIEALREVLRADAEKLRELRGIKRMEGKEQKEALRAMLRSLTPGQREALVGSSDDSDTEACGVPAQRAAAAKAAAKAAPVKLPAAARECPEGHELTPFPGRPPDYKNFDGSEYTCDICGRDGFYKLGVYHCTKCFAKGGKQYDACPSCGQTAAGGGSGGKKQQKTSRKKR